MAKVNLTQHPESSILKEFLLIDQFLTKFFFYVTFYGNLHKRKLFLQSLFHVLHSFMILQLLKTLKILQQKIGDVYMLHALYGFFPKIVHGHYKFGKLVFDF